MNNLTLGTCSFNTPSITLTMLKSFFKHHDKCEVLICDNSTNDETALLLDTYKIPYTTNTGQLHSPSVDILLQNCKTDYLLLVDTDIIFLKNHKLIFDQIKKMDLTLAGEICGDRGGKKLHKRVHPWHCFINVKHIKNNNIKFHDPKRLSSKHTGIIYDVGASFFEDIKNAKLKIGDMRLQDSYYKHYEGMSWRTLKFGATEGNIDTDRNATHNNQSLYEYGKLIEEMYKIEIETYKNIPLLF
jgi:hypothetical protein